MVLNNGISHASSDYEICMCNKFGGRGQVYLTLTLF